MHNKTFKQLCLNKVIDSCMDILGSDLASERQKEFARKLLNRAYKKSGVGIVIHSMKKVQHVR